MSKISQWNQISPEYKTYYTVPAPVGVTTIFTLIFTDKDMLIVKELRYNNVDWFWSKYFTNVLQPTPEELTMFNLEFGDMVFEKMMRGEAL